MTLAEILREEGKNEGRIQGLKPGLEKGIENNMLVSGTGTSNQVSFLVLIWLICHNPFASLTALDSNCEGAERVWVMFFDI